MHGKTWRRISILLFVAAVLMALRLIGPAIPNEIRMLAGPEASTFYADGLQYKEILERHGVTVHLEETSGSLANLADLVEADMPTAGFLLGLSDPTGAERPAPEGIESLGTVGLQPSWVFANRSADLDELQDLKGSRIEAGGTGSDARVLALFLLREEGISDDVEFARHATTADQALEALESKRVAAILAVGEPDSPLIDTLLRSDRLQVLPIRRADAFAIRYRFLKPVRFPEGAHDLRTNIPDQDLQLLAVRTQLAVSELFPPAVADLLLQAATEVHGDATPFSARGEFPRPDTTSLPLSWAADNFYTNGPPKLQRFLPFRLASLVNRFPPESPSPPRRWRSSASCRPSWVCLSS